MEIHLIPNDVGVFSEFFSLKGLNLNLSLSSMVYSKRNPELGVESKFKF